jgi:NTE family protein
MVYGGGGVVGVAYTAGVAAGLASAGVPVASAPALGTSAGAWTASAMALGVSYGDLEELPVPSVPSYQSGLLADLARQVFGDSTHDLVSVSVVSVRSGRRHILPGSAHPLADLVAASSAVPGLLPPHRIGGRLYVDGGMWSATSIDAAEEAVQVIVVAPIAGRVLGPVGRLSGALLERELNRWRLSHPEATIHLIRPNRAMADVIGLRPLGLFDPERARAVYPLACRQGVEWGERIQAVRTPDDRAGHWQDGPAA